MLNPKGAETHWILLIDNLARTYGCLPSEALARADSFDIMVLDVANTYAEYQKSKQNNQAIPEELVNKDDLEDRLKRARGEV